MDKGLFLRKPDIRIYGEIDDLSVRDFIEQLDKALEKEKDDPLLFEVTTIGGDAEGARRIAADIRICREELGREMWFLGKVSVYSAGITMMGMFPQSYRYITQDTVLLIHERRMGKEIDLKDTPMSTSANIVSQLSSQINMALQFETEGFSRLAEGSNLSAEEIATRAKDNWYVRAEEALKLGLVAGIV